MHDIYDAMLHDMIKYCYKNTNIAVNAQSL